MDKISEGTILEYIKEPMEEHHEKMKNTLHDWKPLLHLSEKLLAGDKIKEEDVPPVFAPVVRFMKLAMEKEKWDWANPEIQEVYREIAESRIYRLFAEGTVGIVSSIARNVEIGTLVEVGTGPGQVTADLCREMRKHDTNIPIIVSDKSPTIHQTAKNLRKSFPDFSINEYEWDLRKDPPVELAKNLTPPTLVYERFCIPYSGFEGIDRIAPVADIFLMVEDLNITGRKEAYDTIMEKIGAQFLTFAEAEKYLVRNFPFIHICDKKAVESINAPVIDFTLAMK